MASHQRVWERHSAGLPLHGGGWLMREETKCVIFHYFWSLNNHEMKRNTSCKLQMLVGAVVTGGGRGEKTAEKKSEEESLTRHPSWKSAQCGVAGGTLSHTQIQQRALPRMLSHWALCFWGKDVSFQTELNQRQPMPWDPHENWEPVASQQLWLGRLVPGLRCGPIPGCPALPPATGSVHSCFLLI